MTEEEQRRQQRQTLRKRLIERRLALPAENCAQHSAAIRAHLQGEFPQLSAMKVAFCWPVHKEPDLLPLLARWLGENPAFSALLPVVVQRDAPLAFRAWTPTTALKADRYGIPTPVSGEFVQPTALLLPVNGFDARGFRIGYGGGYFDRTLAALAAAGWPPLAIGVGYELARVETIFPEAHDEPLTAVVTEAGVFRTTP